VILPVDGAYEIERLRLQDGIRYPLKVYKGNTLMGGIFLKLAKGR
jgi:hypothetical protein